MRTAAVKGEMLSSELAIGLYVYKAFERPEPVPLVGLSQQRAGDFAVTGAMTTVRRELHV